MTSEVNYEASVTNELLIHLKPNKISMSLILIDIEPIRCKYIWNVAIDLSKNCMEIMWVISGWMTPCLFPDFVELSIFLHVTSIFSHFENLIFHSKKILSLWGRGGGIHICRRRKSLKFPICLTWQNGKFTTWNDKIP